MPLNYRLPDLEERLGRVDIGDCDCGCGCGCRRVSGNCGVYNLHVPFLILRGVDLLFFFSLQLLLSSL